MRAELGQLTLSVSPNFAAKWLVHRIGRFALERPEIDLRISATLQHVDFAREDVDMAVRHGEGHWPDLAVRRLCREELFPVYSPRIVEGGMSAPRIQRTCVITRWCILTIAGTGANGWRQQLRMGLDLSRGVVFNQASMAIDAAVDGQGVALARTALAAADLLAGRLIRPFALGLPVSYAYYLVGPRASAERPKIRAMTEWLLAEAAEDEARLAALWTLRSLLEASHLSPRALVGAPGVPARCRRGAGAQGRHKLERGYQPVPTHSVHWIREPAFRVAIERFLAQERREMALEIDQLRELLPHPQS